MFSMLPSDCCMLTLCQRRPDHRTKTCILIGFSSPEGYRLPCCDSAGACYACKQDDFPSYDIVSVRPRHLGNHAKSTEGPLDLSGSRLPPLIRTSLGIQVTFTPSESDRS